MKNLIKLLFCNADEDKDKFEQSRIHDLCMMVFCITATLLFATKLKLENLTRLFAMKLKTLTNLLTKEIVPEDGLANAWIPLGIAVVCVAVAYTHSQQSDDDFLVDDGQLSVQADDYKNARSIKAQMLDNLTDEDLAFYCALTGQTAEQLDKEEAEFKKSPAGQSRSL